MTAVSVVLCTHNRAGFLRETLPTIIRQSVPVVEWELVVVDNGSTDDTPKVIDECSRDAPNVRYVHEPELGLSAARNRGIAETHGDIVVFVDDDVLAPPNWLRDLVGGFERFAEAAAVGGRVELALPGPRPDWLPPELDGFLAAFDCGGAAALLPPPTSPVGANMAVRRSWLEELGPFKTSLGRRGSSLAGSEEEEFFLRMHARGGRVAYIPEASLRHVIPPARMEPRWFRRRAFAQGRSSVVLLDVQRRRSRVELLARAVSALVHGIAGPGAALRRITSDRRSRFGGAITSLTWLGCAAECARLAFARRGGGT